MRRTGPLAVFVVAILAIGAYAALPSASQLESWWFSAVGIAFAITIVTAVHGRDVPGAAAWRWFALGIALNSLGTPAATLISNDDAFPSAGDPLYLALYPAIVLGLVLLIRARTARADWGALVDTTTITTGLGLLAWVFVIRPLADDASLGMLARMVSIAYPVGDVVLLSMLVRLMLGSGERNRAFRAIGASLMMFLAGDVAWAVFNEVGWEPTTLVAKLLSMWFLGAYAVLAFGALHRSVRDVTAQGTDATAKVRPLVLALLAAASLIAPGILAYEVLTGEVNDGLAIATGSMVLFLLVVTRMSQLLRHVEAQALQLRDLATIDELTGLPNRRAWTVALPAAIEHARRNGKPLSVALLDLDHFKRFNDELGHQAGDRLLRAAAAAWRNVLRSVDVIARYGGEEFIVLLPDAPGAAADVIIDRLRAATPAGQAFSAGVATWSSPETSDELIARADRALYEAKATGRNRTVVDSAALA